MPNEINFLYKPFFKNKKGIIQVDLDGTLAEYTEWRGIQYIGDPIPEMVRAVKSWIHDGHKVEIFTARANDPESIPYIMEWCRKYLGTDALLITPTKSKDVEEIWDDKSINPVVLKNFNDIMKIQLDPANVKCNDYMHGLSNGLIMGRSIVTGEEPKFIEKYVPLFERTVYDWKGQGNDITNRTWKNSIENKMIEFTIYDWKNKLTSITKKTYADRKKLRGVLEKGIQFIEFDKAHSMAKFLVEPTFDFEAKEAGLAGELRNTNSYEVDLEFVDYDKWIDNWETASLEDFQDMVKVCDVKLHCTCPFWYWGGLRYQATEYDSSIYPLHIPDRHWHQKNEPGLPGICKHQQGVIVKFLRFPEQIFRDIQIKMGIKPKKVVVDKIKEPNVKRISPEKIKTQIITIEPEIKPISKPKPELKKTPEPIIKPISKKKTQTKEFPEPEIEPIESEEEETEE